MFTLNLLKPFQQPRFVVIPRHVIRQKKKQKKNDATMAIINGISDAVTVTFLVSLTFCLAIASVYIWRDIASRYRQRRLNNRQQLPVHRMDLAHNDAPGATRADLNGLNSHSPDGRKPNKYRERILRATTRYQQPLLPTDPPSNEYVPVFEEIPLRKLSTGSDRSGDINHGHRQHPGGGRRGDDMKMGAEGLIPPPLARV